MEITESVQTAPGRICPLRYRYGAAAIAQIEARTAQTLYVIGGLYGNVPALDAIERMAAAESTAPTLCFNGDFNWFNVADEQFTEINRRVLAHDAIQGNVEAEFDAADDDAGCGCAYPDSVEIGIVERSNLIHAQLKATARRRDHPARSRQIANRRANRRHHEPHRCGNRRPDSAQTLAIGRCALPAQDDAAPWT